MKGVAFLPSLILALVLVGCIPAVKNPTPASKAQSTQPSLEPDYRIQVGDQLEVKFYYNPELNEQVIVRPDGRISLQLVQETVATGFTPAELTELLTYKYASELKKPELTVIVRSFGGQRIYVDGEVDKPGMFPLVGIVTVLQAISQAGGLKETARRNEVVVIRHGVANRALALVVNLEKVYDGTEMRQDIPLKPFDIVYVPRSQISDVNVWVDQYIRRNLPISMGFFYNFNP